MLAGRGLPAINAFVDAYNAVSLALQRDMVAKSPCREVISLATDHSPFFSAPGLLADVLTRLAGETDAS